VNEAWVEIVLPADPSWMVAYRVLADESGDAVVAEVRVFPAESSKGRPPGAWSAEVLGAAAQLPAGGLRAEVLRQVTLGEYRQFIPDFQAWRSKQAGRTLRVTLPAAALETPVITPKPGRRPKPDEYYAKFAKEYVDALPRSRSPVADISADHQISQGKVRDIIHEARQRRLLTKTRQGRVGGELTERARNILANPKA